MAYDTRFRPATVEVASYIKNRTVDENNEFLGDFTDGTVVTAIEVGRIIDQAGEMVLAALRWDPLMAPAPIPDDNIPAVRALIAMYSAIVVEVTKFSEQISRQVSPYPYLKTMFDGMLAQKQAELGIQPPAGTGGGGLTLVDLIASQFGGVDYAFPDNLMVNWDTSF
jgi:hypothetical protein